MLLRLPVDDARARVRPSPWVGLLVFVGYLAGGVGLNRIFARDIAKTADDVRARAAHRDHVRAARPGGHWAGLVAAGAARPRTTPGWMWLVPVAGVLSTLGTIAVLYVIRRSGLLPVAMLVHGLVGVSCTLLGLRAPSALAAKALGERAERGPAIVGRGRRAPAAGRR